METVVKILLHSVSCLYFLVSDYYKGTLLSETSVLVAGLSALLSGLLRKILVTAYWLAEYT